MCRPPLPPLSTPPRDKSSGVRILPAAKLAEGSSRKLLRHRRRQHQHRSEQTSEQVLDAAALQDRLMRRMKLDLGGQQPRAVLVVGESGAGSGRYAHRGGMRRRRFGRGTTGGRSDDNTDANTSAASQKGDDGVSTAWTCQACSAENYSNSGATRDGGNSGQPDICSVCVQARQWRRPPAAETGGRAYYEGGGRGRSEGQEHQQQRKVAVTLAQIRGLEEPPEPALTPGEWRWEVMLIHSAQTVCVNDPQQSQYCLLKVASENASL